MNSYGAGLAKHYYKGNPDVKPHIEASQQGWAEAYLTSASNNRTVFGPSGIASNKQLKVNEKKPSTGVKRRLKSKHRRGTSYRSNSRMNASALGQSIKSINVEIIPERKDARLPQGGQIIIQKKPAESIKQIEPFFGQGSP